MESTASLRDEDLISLARERQSLRGESAFAELYQRHHCWVLRVCRRFLHDWAEAEDACQWIFLRAFCSLEAYQGRSAFRTWLYRITVNVCLSQRTRLLQRRTHEVDLPEGSKELVMPNGPERRAARSLKECLEGLPERDCEILTLHSCFGWTFEEIAAQTGLSSSGAKMRFYRALNRLRRQEEETRRNRKAFRQVPRGFSRPFVGLPLTARGR